MKKSKLLLTTISAVAIALVSCGKKEEEISSMITVDPLSAGEVGIKKENLPDKKSIKQRTGQIDICLDFEGRHVGWERAAREYERLMNGAVKVNINWQIAGSEYGARLNQELQNVKKTGSSEWDIVEGNLGYGNTRQTCVDFHTFINSPNAWCGAGNEQWSDVLSRRAYYNFDTDRSWGNHYILSTEDMQSCWFVNNVALQAAGEKGYRNEKGEIGMPIVWDDLINLCAKMQEAGYTNPLGISLSSSSIRSLQFTWLLRIYGDYYYRQFYKFVMSGDSKTTWAYYDPTDPNVENGLGFGTKHCKVLNLLFDEDTDFGPGYVGFNSEVYKDFVSQLYKMKGYFITNAQDTDFSGVRADFQNQGKGKGSAQIILDYLGQGISYKNKETSDFKLGYFDYPQMKSGTFKNASTNVDNPEYAHEPGDKIVDDNTITRDIGGNGGFVSIINQAKSEQTELSKDFIKFFLSPYGQSFYYKGLEESNTNIAPKGLTTVDNDLVNIPESWSNFFGTATSPAGGIKFNGNVDANTFITYGVRYFAGYEKSEAAIVDNWNKLLNSNQKYDVDGFAADWNKACFDDYITMCNDSDHQWPTDMYLDPDGKL